ILVHFVMIGLITCIPVDSDNFSYHRFSGPVSGELKEVLYNKKNRRFHDVDYEAKPDYAYVYGVQDNESGNSQVHKEMRDGDKVLGEYRVLQPDGMIRIVRYIADPIAGFKATVNYVEA
ncbi:hypothetical protein NQ315_008018, partial [Exocentrus adspersus]